MSRRKLETDMKSYSSLSKVNLHLLEYEKLNTVSEEWCLWTTSFLSGGWERQESKQIVNAAAFSGHLGALKYWKR